MRLPRPFYQLPMVFDVKRLQAEVLALPDEAWVAHPDAVPGNSAVRLISVEGQETDAHQGQMLPTSWLSGMPYVRQVLAEFGVVWGRSRLMRLAAGAVVPDHADIHHHWHSRVRMHVPIITFPEVLFHCDGETVHMGAGEAWIFDNWRRHRVENNAASDRVHLVADTSGTAGFWQLALGPARPRAAWSRIGWDPNANRELLTESDQRQPVMPSPEVQLLLDDFRSELTTANDTPEQRTRLVRFNKVLESFTLDWRQLCALNGLSGRGRSSFLDLREALRGAANSLGDGLVMRSNRASALLVLEKRLLAQLVGEEADERE